MKINTLFVAATLFLSTSAFAVTVSTAAPEPAYCIPANFHSLEVPTRTNGLVRAKTYQLGQLTLVGMAIGFSPIALVKDLSAKYSAFTSDEKYCTWYFNDGNDLATQWFHHRYVSNPAYSLPGLSVGLANEYEKTLKGIFADDPVSFLSCVRDHNYLAMGCDGMRHRGPTVFAMFLAYSGCSPQNAVTIANQIWGSNFVSVETRLAIADRAYKLGQKNPTARSEIQTVLSTY